jgi:hypothetical protein
MSNDDDDDDDDEISFIVGPGPASYADNSTLLVILLCGGLFVIRVLPSSVPRFLLYVPSLIIRDRAQS